MAPLTVHVQRDRCPHCGIRQCTVVYGAAARCHRPCWIHAESSACFQSLLLVSKSINTRRRAWKKENAHTGEGEGGDMSDLLQGFVTESIIREESRSSGCILRASLWLSACPSPMLPRCLFKRHRGEMEGGSIDPKETSLSEYLSPSQRARKNESYEKSCLIIIGMRVRAPRPRNNTAQ